MGDQGVGVLPGSAEGAEVPLPTHARVHLAHALMQRIAEGAGVDLLHLKGPAVLPGLRPVGRKSGDVDVLVRPAHFPRLVEALASRGWVAHTRVETGSLFGHAANWWHPDWGYADLHARWPGTTATPEVTFDVLSEQAFDQDIAHVPCRVPGQAAQVLILLLHAARTTGSTDARYVWDTQSVEQQAAVTALGDRLGAQVALASALGNLDAFRDDPTYPLWRFYAEGGSRIDEWRARYAAASGRAERWQVVRAALVVNPDHLHTTLGRAPTAAELRRAQLTRVTTLLGDVRDAVTLRWRARRGSVR
jgi:hypothetical protein